jgi:hypothetical protein
MEKRGKSIINPNLEAQKLEQFIHDTAVESEFDSRQKRDSYFSLTTKPTSGFGPN